jgi:hypothetical protein
MTKSLNGQFHTASMSENSASVPFFGEKAYEFQRSLIDSKKSWLRFELFLRNFGQK